MGRLRSLITQSPAIVISILAVAVSLGGGAYASTHHGSASNYPPVRVSTAPAASHSVATAGVTWTSLSLTNGWASENGTFQSGNPKVGQQSGIVYLSGSLHQPTPGSSQFATLPSSFRPSHNMWITVYTVSDTSGTLFIGHDGTMEAFAPGNCGSGNTAQCFTSLAGVSFPINS
jgi:hypothetical protein